MIIRITLPVEFTYGERKFNLSVKRSDSLDENYLIRLVPPAESKPPSAPSPVQPESESEPLPEKFQLYNKNQNLLFEFEHPAWLLSEISVGYTITYNAKLEREDVYSDLPDFLRREMEQFEVNIINQWASKAEGDTATFDRTNMELIIDVATGELDDARAAVVKKAFAGYRKPARPAASTGTASPAAPPPPPEPASASRPARPGTVPPPSPRRFGSR